MIVVIADDITGAAEIAGIALDYGQRACVVTDAEGFSEGGERYDVVVVATDTRSGTRQEAIAESCKVTAALIGAGHRTIFKKTDSVLRGYVVDELSEIMRVGDFQSALLLPQNPSRGRVIRGGEYFIEGVSLDHTQFGHDPEFPCKSSLIKNIVTGVHIIDPHTTKLEHGISVGNGETTNDIAAYGKLTEEKILVGGGADCFEMFLKFKGVKKSINTEKFSGLDGKRTVVICGSTADHNIKNMPYIIRNSVPVCMMPKDVFMGEVDYKAWCSSISDAYDTAESVVVGIGHPSQGGREFAVRLRRTMAEITAELVSKKNPQEIVIEGGATTFAVMRRMGWNRFEVCNLISPGVVRMRPENTDIYLTIKPGSYQWGEMFS